MVAKGSDVGSAQEVQCRGPAVGSAQEIVYDGIGVKVAVGSAVPELVLGHLKTGKMVYHGARFKLEDTVVQTFGAEEDAESYFGCLRELNNLSVLQPTQFLTLEKEKAIRFDGVPISLRSFLILHKSELWSSLSQTEEGCFTDISIDQLRKLARSINSSHEKGITFGDFDVDTVRVEMQLGNVYSASLKLLAPHLEEKCRRKGCIVEPALPLRKHHDWELYQDLVRQMVMVLDADYFKRPPNGRPVPNSIYSFINRSLPPNPFYYIMTNPVLIKNDQLVFHLLSLNMGDFRHMLRNEPCIGWADRFSNVIATLANEHNHYLTGKDSKEKYVQFVWNTLKHFATLAASAKRELGGDVHSALRMFEHQCPSLFVDMVRYLSARGLLGYLVVAA